MFYRFKGFYFRTGVKMRKVFFSFHYGNDVNRSMIVRNSQLTHNNQITGFVDKVEFEKIHRTNSREIHSWIEQQLDGTSVTVVLIGSETLDRDYVRYEILRSWTKNNAIIGVRIHSITDMRTLSKDIPGNIHTELGKNNLQQPIFFDEICDAIYDYVEDDGYNNLGNWIESAAKNHGK